ncbi:MAG TPA: hypothetical protein VK184_05365 [Nostocaceae cyanobacterium]|nr:hypothetical protein [Nostocaceae cyanobacterium]
MHCNIRQTILFTALSVLGAVSLTPKAFADSQVVPFTATVNSVCTLSNVVPGNLGADMATNTLDSTITTSPATNTPGFSGSITITCNSGSGSYNIGSTTNTTAFAGAPAVVGLAVNAASSFGTSTATGTTNTGAGNVVNVSGTTPTVINIDLAATYGSALAAGDYSFDVVIQSNP